MYPNVNAERARKNITMEDVAKAWDCTVGTVSLKLSGKSIITLREAVILKELFNYEESLEELFKEAS